MKGKQRMKKTVKKIFALILTAVMISAMVTGSLAASLTVTDTEGNPKETSTFEAYRVLEWNALDGADVYTNIEPCADFEAFFAAHEEYSIENISKLKAEEMSALTDALQLYVNENGIASTATSTAAKFDNLDYGYYLVLETETAAESATVASKAMLVCVPAPGSADAGDDWSDDIVVVAKDSKVDIEKDIVNEDGSLTDANTVSVGDVVDYRITGTVPKYDTNIVLESIVYAVKDTLSKGLTLNKDTVVVTAGGDTLTENVDYTLSVTTLGEDTSFVINFVYANIMNYDKVVVEYNATVNEKAVTGAEGNPNSVKLEYTTTPEKFGSAKPGETEETPEEKTLSFCTEIRLTKVDAKTGEPLKGVKFAIFTDEECTVPASFATVDIHTTTNQAGEVISVVSEKRLGSAGEEISTGDDGIAYFMNLAEGTYYIKETEALKNYSELEEPIKVVITADLPEAVIDGTETAVWNAVATLGDETLTVDAATGLIGFTVINTLGVVLPGTGGIGTALFTVFGIAIISTAAVCAAVVYKKRKNY